MTSQINSARMMELSAQAKEIGVKGVHLFRSEDTLMAAIAKAQGKEVVEPIEIPVVEETMRKKAPDMIATRVRGDERERKVAELEAADPECKYIFQHHSITDEELLAKGFQRTGHSVKNSILVKTTKESYDESIRIRNRDSLYAMKKIDKAEVYFKGHSENPKEAPSKLN